MFRRKDDSDTRASAALALGRIGPKAIPALEKRAEGKPTTVVRAADGTVYEYPTCWRPPGVTMAGVGGVLTGMMWLQTASGTPWTGSAHETWCVVAWVVYGVLVSARFAAHQGSRSAAASAVGGFAFLFFAVIGLELIA